VLVALDEAHGELGKVAQLALGELGRHEVREHHLSLPGHPHQRDRVALDRRAQVERILRQDAHA